MTDTFVLPATAAGKRPSAGWPPEIESPRQRRASPLEGVLHQIDSGDIRRILDAAVAILRQGEELLSALSPDTYAQKVPVVFNASIGGHYRHCLDHFTSLVRGLEGGAVDYDHRERDTRLETQPALALALTRQMRMALERLAPEALDMPVAARCEVSYARGQSPTTRSTLARELVYVIAHAIHHYALISVMARLLKAGLPEHFGVAPSTVAHLAAGGSR
jgi:uncharacterized damage-inducible protein DinB